MRWPAVLAVAAVLAAAAGVVLHGLHGPRHQAEQAAPAASVPAPTRPRVRRPAPPPALQLRLPRTLPRRMLAVPILMYHRVGPLAPSLPPLTRALTVTPAAFAAEMRWLRAHGFHVISQLQLFEGLERGRPLPASPVMITFDDGYRDVLWNAAPLLERLHMPATVYVITARVDAGDPSFLTWPELRRLEQRGVAIGSHTVHHVELPLLPTAQALEELRQSRAALQRHLHHPVQWFSYPAGAENARTAWLVRQAGYVLAVTTRPGARQSSAEPLALHRDEVLDTTGVAGLAALLDR